MLCERGQETKDCEWKRVCRRKGEQAMKGREGWEGTEKWKTKKMKRKGSEAGT